MNKELKKELLKYTSAAAAVLAGTTAQGQYQYTNIPDTTVDYNAGYYDLDLDQDGSMDFRLVQYVDTGAAGNTDAVLIQPYSGAAAYVSGNQVNTYNYPFKLQASTVLDQNANWNGMGGQHQTGYLAFKVDGQSYPNSNWVGPVEDGYLGLVILNGIEAHYGWCRLDIGADSKSFTVKDFSINLTPDSSMVVGYELLGEFENAMQSIAFHVQDDHIQFRLNQFQDELNVRLIDISGRELKSASLSPSNQQFYIGSLPRAIYVLEMESNGLVRREKVLVY